MSIATPYTTDVLITYHICPKMPAILVYYLWIRLLKHRISGKQCRHWSDAAKRGVWSGSTLFILACLSQYLHIGLFWYIGLHSIRQNHLWGIYCVVGSRLKSLFTPFRCSFKTNVLILFNIIWDAMSENVPSDICAQRRFRSDCTFAQSDLNRRWAHFG